MAKPGKTPSEGSNRGIPDVARTHAKVEQIRLLPVVSYANMHQLEGVVKLQNVLALYGMGRKEAQC